jgi:uncharacterized protein DUF4337
MGFAKSSTHPTNYQAKNIRQTDYNLAADAIELAFLQDGSLNAEAKAALKAKADAYRKTAARYESEPETREGKKELMVRAKEYENKRSRDAIEKYRFAPLILRTEIPIPA